MYNLFLFLVSLNNYSDSKIITIFVLSISSIFLLREISRKIKLNTEKGLIFNRKQKIPLSNYSLAFDEVETLNKLPAKKILAVTKIVLYGFSFAFVVIPFVEFLPTFSHTSPNLFGNFMCCLGC